MTAYLHARNSPAVIMLGSLRFWLSVFVTGLAAVICLPIVLIFPVTGVWRVAKVWSWIVLKVCNVRVETTGLEQLDKESGYLVLSNHSSLFDVVALYRVIPFPIRFVAKRELTYVPIFGQVLQMGAAIIVDRGDRKRAIASVERARESIEKGQSILVFPEGTRTPEGSLGSLKKGPFYIATEAQVPVLPVGVKGSGYCLASGAFSANPGVITVSAGEPFGVEGYSPNGEGRNRLNERVRAELEKLIA